MKREYFPLNMYPIDVFKLFAKFDIPHFEVKNTRTIVCYEIKDLQLKREIEKLLIEDAIEANLKVKGEVLVSNKRKPLYMSLQISDTNIPMWELRIYQERAKGIILNKLSGLENYAAFPFELATVLLLLTQKYLAEKNERELQRKNQELRSEFKMFKHEQMLLKKEDLEYFLTIDYITSPERNQVLYTFDYYKSQKCMHPEMIESLAQSQAAFRNNAEIQPIIDLCKECFDKFDFLPSI